MTDVMELPVQTPRALLPALQSYSTYDVCREAGVSYRMLDYWIRTGHARPSIATAAGSGTQRRFSHEDLLVIRLIARLRKVGCPLAAVDPDVMRAAVRSGCRRLLVAPDGRWARADEAHVLLNSFRRLGSEAWLVDAA